MKTLTSPSDPSLASDTVRATSSREKRKCRQAQIFMHTEIAQYRVDEAFHLCRIPPESCTPRGKFSCRISLLINGNIKENGEAAFQVLHYGEVLDWRKIEPSLLHLLQELVGKLMHLNTHEQQQHLFMRQLRVHILENLLTEGFGVKALGQLVGYCPAQLTRLIEKYAQLHPSAFIHQVRIEEACHLLKTTCKRISEVAFAVGYVYPTNFSSKFKALTGMTPRAYAYRYRV